MDRPYTAKRAAMLLTKSWLTGEGNNPYWMTTADMNAALPWSVNGSINITERRRIEIRAQVTTILATTIKRIDTFIEREGL